MPDDIRLSISITRKQYDYIRKIVDELGISISDYIKLMIYQMMGRNNGNKSNQNLGKSILLESNKDLVKNNTKQED